MKESELAEKFVAHFNESGYDVYSEVECAGFIDIVAVDANGIISAIEVKLHFNLDVIKQAYKNLYYSHRSYIAVPYSKDMVMGEVVCRNLGIGVLVYRDFAGHTQILETVKPRLQRKITKPKLQPYQKLSVAGSVNERITPFKLCIFDIEEKLNRIGTRVDAKQFFSENHYHYSHSDSAYQCIRKLSNDGTLKNIVFHKRFIMLARYGK